MTFLTLAILGLATYRITRLLIVDTLAEPLRHKVWAKYPPQNTKIGYLFACPWCMSFWVASFLTISAMIIPVLVYFYTVFAVAGISSLLTAYEEK